MIYDLLSRFYDSVNADIDYVKWADFIEAIIKREYKGKPELMLDLGCGTGKMTLELAERGYDMTGVDYSADMLDVAREAAEKTGRDILLLCQDMREFELYGTVDVTVSCLDCINHLTKPTDVEKVFKLVHNYLIPDGLFIFDINGKYKFENIYADNSYVMEEDGGMCVWQNYYNPKTKLCDFYITVFEEGNDGRYDRYDETGRERMYKIKDMEKMLQKCGMEFIGAYSDYDFTPATDDSERIYIAARCKKGNLENE